MLKQALHVRRHVSIARGFRFVVKRRLIRAPPDGKEPKTHQVPPAVKKPRCCLSVITACHFSLLALMNSWEFFFFMAIRGFKLISLHFTRMRLPKKKTGLAVTAQSGV